MKETTITPELDNLIKYRDLKAKVLNGSKLTFKERNLMNMIEKKRKKAERLKK
jgi:hypothetical protein